MGRDVRGCNLPDPGFFSILERYRGELDCDVVLVADPDDDEPSARIRHRRDVTSKVAPRRITICIALLFEVQIGVLAHGAGDETRQMFLCRILLPGAEEIGQSKRPCAG